MADFPITSGRCYIKYNKEATFGTKPSTITEPFGFDLTADIEFTRNLIKMRGLGDRNVSALVDGNFDGQITINGTVGSTHWLAQVMGTSISSGSAPYTHTYSEGNSLYSISMELGFDLDSDKAYYILGCKCDNVDLTFATGEPLRFKAVYFFKTITPTATITAKPYNGSFTPFDNSAGAVVFNGSVLPHSQKWSINISNGLIKTYGLASNFVQDLTPGARDYTLTIERPFENYATLTQLLTGSATTVEETVNHIGSCYITATTGTTTTLNEIKIDLAKMKINKDTLGIGQPDERVDQTVELIACQGTITCKDIVAVTVFD